MKQRRYEIGTPEDLEIWSRFNQRQMSKVRLPDFGWISLSSDRRDADLMYMLTRVQMREIYDRQTWISGGPDGELITLRPAAMIYVDAQLL